MVTLWTTAIAVLTLSLGSAGPASVPTSEPPESAESTADAQTTIQLAQHYAETSRKGRLVRGSLTVAFGSVQLGLGIFGTTAPEFSPVMRRSGVAQLLLGTAGISMGVLGLARRSAMERFTASPTFAALVAEPENPVLMRRVDRDWRDYARTARRWRWIMGSGYIAAGAGLVVTGTVLLFPRLHTQSDVSNQWAFVSLGTGVGLALGGTLSLATKSDVERAYAAHRAIPALAARPVQPRLRIFPSAGGATISGWF